jgi:hypothetical protein
LGKEQIGRRVSVNNIIKIREIIDCEFAITFDDGEKVYNQLKPVLQNEKTICLDFEGISEITPLFLNSIFVKGYEEFGDNFSLSFVNILTYLVEIIELCLKNSKNYASLSEEEKERRREIFKKIMEEME